MFRYSNHTTHPAGMRREKEGKDMFLYGMRLRGFSIGCQPIDGFIRRIDDTSGKYWDVIAYNRPLSDKELENYELDYIGYKEI